MQVAHYFSKSAAEETSRRDELIARGSCCGENCRDCPYNPKHTSGATALKDPTEKHVKAQEPTPPPSWEPAKSAVAAHLKAAYAMSPEARAYYESNRKPREQLAQEHFAQAQQATARQNEERANAELQRFDNLSYPQKFWEKSKEMYGDTANMIGEGLGGYAPYAGATPLLNRITPGFLKGPRMTAAGSRLLQGELVGGGLRAAGDLVEKAVSPFAKARALQLAARNTKPGDTDYEQLKGYKDVGLWEAQAGYRMQDSAAADAARETERLAAREALTTEPSSFKRFIGNLTTAKPPAALERFAQGRWGEMAAPPPAHKPMPELNLHSNSHWVGGEDSIRAGIKRAIPWENPVAGAARGLLGIPANAVGGVQDSARHAWDAATPGKWKTTPDTKQVANPYYGAVDSTGQAVPQYHTLQAQKQRPLFGTWNSEGNGAAVAQDLQNREQFEQDPRNYWDKVTDTHVAANAPDGSPVRAFKYPANVEFHPNFTATPMTTPNSIIGKPGQRTAVTGNPAYDPNKFDNQPKWLNLGQPAPPKAPTPPTSPIARK